MRRAARGRAVLRLQTGMGGEVRSTGLGLGTYSSSLSLGKAKAISPLEVPSVVSECGVCGVPVASTTSRSMLSASRKW